MTQLWVIMSKSDMEILVAFVRTVVLESRCCPLNLRSCPVVLKGVRRRQAASREWPERGLK